MLSRRERYIGIGAGASVGLLVLNWYVLTPLIDYSDSLTQQKLTLVRQLESANRLLHTRITLGRQWRKIRSTTLKTTASEAESQLLNTQRQWSQQSGLVLDSIKPERQSKLHDLQELSFGTSGAGTMNAVAGFLYRLETAPMPIRVRELQIASRSEGKDDLTLGVRVSTLYEPPVKKTADAGPATPVKEDE